MPKYPKRREDLVDRVVDDERVLLDSEKNLIHKLNMTASVIWDLCDGATSVDEIATRVGADFGTPREEIEADVRALIEQLAQLGVVSFDGANP